MLKISLSNHIYQDQSHFRKMLQKLNHMVKNKENIPVSLKKSVDSLPKRGVLCTTFLPAQKASYWLLLVRLKAPILMRVFSKIGRS